MSGEAPKQTPAKSPKKFAPPPLTEVKIGGVRIDLTTTPNTVSVEEEPLFKKEDRANLGDEKRQDLFEKATKKGKNEFDLVPLSLTDEEKLEDTYGLDLLVEWLRAHYVTFDMHGEFQHVVRPLAPGSPHIDEKETKNLFELYETMTEEEVALSNEWYNTWPDPKKQPWHRENAQLTIKHLQNNMSIGLWEKVSERLHSYEVVKRGGSLIFIIMMKFLTTNSEEALEHLKNIITDLKITDFEGEDIFRVVSLLRGALKRFKRLKKIPEDFNSKVLKILATSSVPEFNDNFTYVERISDLHEKFRATGQELSSTVAIPPADASLRVAELKYMDFLKSGTWTGASTKGKGIGIYAAHGSGRAAQGSGNGGTRDTSKDVCWNCGGQGHSIKDCSKPRNEERIKQNRKKFFEEKRGGRGGRGGRGRSAGGRGGGRGRGGDGDNGGRGNGPFGNSDPSQQMAKFRAPSTEENKRRVIDGTHMFWSTRHKKWIPDRDFTTPQANLVGDSSEANQQSSTLADQAGRRAAMANARSQFQSAFDTLEGAFQ